MLSNTSTLSAPSLKISFYRVTHISFHLCIYPFHCSFIHCTLHKSFIVFISFLHLHLHGSRYRCITSSMPYLRHHPHPCLLWCYHRLRFSMPLLPCSSLPFPVRCLSFLSESLDFSISLNFILFYCTLLYSTLLYITFPFLSLNLINSHHII